MSDWKSNLETAKELLESGIIPESYFEELKAEILKQRDASISSDMIDTAAAEGELEPMEMVLLPAGEFMMGAAPDDKAAYEDEIPHHKVEITKDFYVGKYAVTQRAWETVMGNNPSKYKGKNRPVERVRWFDCILFCNKLSVLEGKEPVYQGLEGYQMGQQFSNRNLSP